MFHTINLRIIVLLSIRLRRRLSRHAVSGSDSPLHKLISLCAAFAAINLKTTAHGFIARSASQVTDRPFNLIVSFER
jgi:hypothetical protein